MLQKRAYIGFMPPHISLFSKMNDSPQEDEELGSDLYPHDFLMVLKDPPNYCNGELFFGRDEINDVSDYGNLFLPNLSSNLDNIEFIDSNPSCPVCNDHLILNEETGETVRSHFGKVEINILRLSGKVWPNMHLNSVGVNATNRINHTD